MDRSVVKVKVSPLAVEENKSIGHTIKDRLHALTNLPKFLFGSHAFGNVTASARNTNRLSLFIMKNLPALLEEFDAAIRHDDPIFDRARRALVEARYKGCIHFRAILRMNEFKELWTRGVETRRVSLKDSVCLLWPNHVQALQL